jgi:(p)ppGpp synthase/HD superfamily hydrolase
VVALGLFDPSPQANHVFSAGIDRAIVVALEAHAGQTRKGLDGHPYVIHPLHVGLMLARFDLDEEVIQAGILHDVVEDCDSWTHDRIEELFGARVSALVVELSEDKSLSWGERKQWAVDHVAHMSIDGCDVKACDKLHNLSSLLGDLERAADHSTVWSTFGGGPERTLHMARALVDALRPRVHARISTALDEVMLKLEAL